MGFMKCIARNTVNISYNLCQSRESRDIVQAVLLVDIPDGLHAYKTTLVKLSPLPKQVSLCL